MTWVLPFKALAYGRVEDVYKSCQMQVTTSSRRLRPHGTHLRVELRTLMEPDVFSGGRAKLPVKARVPGPEVLRDITRTGDDDMGEKLIKNNKGAEKSNKKRINRGENCLTK